MTRPLVEARELRKTFRRGGSPFAARGPALCAVDGVDLDVRAGETVGLVGESGSGKTTLGRLIVRLVEADSGRLHFDGVDLRALAPEPLRRMRRGFQVIFQDPHGSLNPRMRVGQAVGEPLVVHRIVTGRAARERRVAELLAGVGLEPAAAARYPHEFSGGQRQRIGIARAIACSPRFIVADEPVSALDPPVQAQIINLLLELQQRLGLAYLFIAHDLRLVEHISDRVAVMYLGRIVEQADRADLFARPEHPYTRALLASTPATDPGRPAAALVPGEMPSAIHPPPGCAFHPRCPVAEPRCARSAPALLEIGPGHKVACHLAGSSGETNPDGDA